ncbi:MAG: PQQ-dependent sugar dehydrogenase [Cyclobacteriaceae bacterium]|nr:PQQ-dependent sugar dehydrogenase [Cyclobacteriaceae bacterium]
MKRKMIPGFIILTVSLLACSEKDQVTEVFSGPVIESEKQKFGIDTITDKLEFPWGMAFLPDGRILVTERGGNIRIVKDGKLLEEKVQGVPAVFVEGQGGLMDIQLHPEYAKNGWIYFSYAKPGEGGGGTTIARAKLEGNTLTALEELFSAQPFSTSGVHFGCRIAFDGNGYMFFSSGERGTKENAQNLSNHLGKILRLHDDGRVPADNPFVSTAGAKSEIWSYGHRNPQGLIYDKETNTLWDAEHGPRGGDELNKVEKGKNYGWPVVTYGINYDGTPITDITEKEGMEQPVHYWVPSIATCGLMQVTSDKYPNWKNNLMVGALALTHVARVELADGKYIKEEKLLDKIARVRAVAQSPEGYIYVATESPGMLLRLVPVK